MSNGPLLLRCNSCRALNRVPAERLGEHPICGRCKAPLEFPRTAIRGTSGNFREEVLEWPGIALVEFWSKWCGICRQIAPLLDQLASERAGRVKVVKIEVNEEPHVSNYFRIKATPTLMLYNAGRKVNEIAGSLNKQQVEDWMDGSLRG